MKIALTVNGERREAEVEPRTQLAAALRDGLHLTGTHLSCEQGVCGACTILVDGMPIRSCIAYAISYDGATIETIEGFQSDGVMTALRRAFAEHHALQCGFCTPGMIVTARDIVLRLNIPDEARIRHELSGNLCRCTGYVGIVRAIAAVIAERALAAPSVPAPAPRAPLRPFALAAPAAAKAAPVSGSVTIRDGWTHVTRRLALSHPPEEVARLFADIERVAPCLPGARATSVEGDSFAGEIAISFGPIRAAFQGQGRRKLEAEGSAGLIEAEGKDASGQSNVRGELAYRIGAAGSGSEVGLDLRFQLKGLLAQFNRPDLVESFVDVLLSRFGEACDAALSGKAPAEARPLGAFGLAFALLRRRLARLFGS